MKLCENRWTSLNINEYLTFRHRQRRGNSFGNLCHRHATFTQPPKQNRCPQNQQEHSQNKETQKPEKKAINHLWNSHESNCINAYDSFELLKLKSISNLYQLLLPKYWFSISERNCCHKSRFIPTFQIEIFPRWKGWYGCNITSLIIFRDHHRIGKVWKPKASLSRSLSC